MDGVVSRRGRRPGDHVCWPFRRDTDAVEVAQAYVAEGLAGQERVAYVGEGGPDELRHDLDGVPGLDDELDRGRLQLVPMNSVARLGRVGRPGCRVAAACSDDRERARSGLSRLTDVRSRTNRVRDLARRAQHVRYEHLIDRFCLEHPLTMLCAYDAAALGNSAVAELACVHALAHETLSPFQVRAARSADAALAGNIDVFCTDQLEQALQRIGIATPGATVVIDAAGWSSWTPAGCSPWIGTPRPVTPSWCFALRRPL